MKKIIIAISFMALMAAACDSSNSLNNQQSSPNGQSQNASSTSQTGQVKDFTVVAQNYSFAPNEITVNKGDTVRITLQSVGGFHDFVLDEFNVKTSRINTGQAAQAEFVADKTGSFEFYCSVSNHRQMGMKGALTVR